MRYRTFGRTGWQVSEIGYGTWGMGDWTGSDDRQSLAALESGLAGGVNFFDTAQSYGNGHSEQLLGLLLARSRAKRVYVATKVPPKDRRWPSKKGTALASVFPRGHVREYVDISRSNLGVDTIDLLQLHVWEDDWLVGGDLAATVAELKREGAIRAFGISLNRWQPWNGIAAVRSGLVDAVQVIYNIFEQSPEDELFAACREQGVAVIARVPFDEGSLTGSLTRTSSWPENDWRSRYFDAQNLEASLARVEALEPLVPADGSLAELALRFILSNPDVSTVIPGMRDADHVGANLAAAARGPLPPSLIAQLRRHRWDRQPTGVPE